MIVVDLSSLEDLAFRVVKDVPEEGVEGAMILDVMVRFNLPIEAAAQRAMPLIEAARSARRKIAEATRYEIRVVDA